MLSDITSDQQDSPRCGHCGGPLNGRFARCPSCHALPVDSLDARAAPRPPLHIPLEPPPSTLDARLPARKIWRPLSRDLINSYEVVEDQAVVAPPFQRLRHSLAIGGSVLVVSSAVYLGFLHSNDSGERPPIEVSGTVKTQNAVPPIAAGQRQRAAPQTSHATALAAQPASVAATQRQAVAAQRAPVVVTQRAAPAASQHAPVVVAQQPVIDTAQRPAPHVSQQAPAVVAQQPAIDSTRRPAAHASQQAPALVAQQPVIDTAQRATPHVSQQAPAVVAQQPAIDSTRRPAPTVSPHAPAVLAQQSVTETAHRPTPNVSQHVPQVVAQRSITTPVTSPQSAAAATGTIARATPAPTVQQRPTLATNQHAAPALSTQRPLTIASQRAAPVRLPPLSAQPNAAPLAPSSPSSAPTPRRVAMLASDTSRNTDSPEDKARADATRHLKAARTDLQQNNLSATRTRLAAAIAMQPHNRDALTLRSTLATREQQRDALLSLARGCGNVAHWSCMRHNANTALQIDSSSKEAQRLVTLAMREADPPFTLPPPPAADSAPDSHDMDNHH